MHKFDDCPIIFIFQNSPIFWKNEIFKNTFHCLNGFCPVRVLVKQVRVNYSLIQWWGNLKFLILKRWKTSWSSQWRKFSKIGEFESNAKAGFQFDASSSAYDWLIFNIDLIGWVSINFKTRLSRYGWIAVWLETNICCDCL